MSISPQFGQRIIVGKLLGPRLRLDGGLGGRRLGRSRRGGGRRLGGGRHRLRRRGVCRAVALAPRQGDDGERKNPGDERSLKHLSFSSWGGVQSLRRRAH